jgi:hypothetical protein
VILKKFRAARRHTRRTTSGPKIVVSALSRHLNPKARLTATDVQDIGRLVAEVGVLRHGDLSFLARGYDGGTLLPITYHSRASSKIGGQLCLIAPWPFTFPSSARTVPRSQRSNSKPR